LLEINLKYLLRKTGAGLKLIKLISLYIDWNVKRNPSLSICVNIERTVKCITDQGCDDQDTVKWIEFILI
jgi:hypothetical protein